MDENTSWPKQLAAGIGMLVIVGLLVGGVVALVALKAADVAGVGDPRVESTEPPPGLGPSGLGPSTATPTTGSPTDPPAATTAPTTTSPTTTSPTTTTAPTTMTTTTKPPAPQPVIQLFAAPQQAATYERVNLTGVYRTAPEGTTVQVQRAEGDAWVDFPTSATVSGGTFSTYIETGVTGLNRFRVLDTSTSRASNVVIVEISAG